MAVMKIPGVVYHYCSVNTFMSIIEKSSLRMTNISKSNDYAEITFCINMFVEVLEKAIDIVGKKSESKSYQEFCNSVNITKLVNESISNASLMYYVSCFSTESDLLSQWRGYADDGQGVAIGFATENFIKSSNSTYWKFSPIYYSILECAEFLPDNIAEYYLKIGKEASVAYYESVTKDIVDRMIFNAVFFKNPAFAEEKEVRFVYYPFGMIRNLKYRHGKNDITVNQLFYDKMSDSVAMERIGDFVRKPLAFMARNNTLLSYFDVDFGNVKQNLIKDIVLGPKSKLNDMDLRLFLFKNGYDIANINIRQSNATYR